MTLQPSWLGNSPNKTPFNSSNPSPPKTPKPLNTSPPNQPTNKATNKQATNQQTETSSKPEEEVQATPTPALKDSFQCSTPVQ